MRVYFADIRAANLCAPGFYRWARERKWSNQRIRDFLKDGLPLDEVAAMDDPFAQRTVTAARNRIEREAVSG
jgi:hypothetical protein